ncbi:GNAT family N-acetyltransferase [Kitasatospora sp. McL0602]|uniref:GNAT family N-acetyltransferase n=1 Tax=Kitasatospora sp. McL0602 TaxID=3439530 RepID=UPI003F8A1305
MALPPVTLRPLTLDDWPAVHSWARLEAACRYQPWGPNTEDQTRAYVRSAVERSAQDQPTRLVHLAHAEGVPVGIGDFHIRHRAHRQGEIAYTVHPDAWGRGFGTAIAQHLLAHGFEQAGLHRIYATCDPRNLASARVLAKLGMTYEGRQRHSMLIRDGWRDSDVFSILEEEWRGDAGKGF